MTATGSTTQDWDQNFGRVVRAYRVQARWTEHDLAVRARISKHTVERIERGRYVCATTSYEQIRDALAAELGPDVAPVLDRAWAELVAWSKGQADVTAATTGHADTASVSKLIYLNMPVTKITKIINAPSISRRAVLTGGALLMGGSLAALILLPDISLPTRALLAGADSGRPGGSSPDISAIGTEDLQLAGLDGWYPKAVASELASRNAIAMHNARTGDEEKILTPEGSPYSSYMGPLWLPHDKQLFYIAATHAGDYDIWHTPLDDNGPNKPPTPRKTPPNMWPQALLRNRGPNCTSLALTHDGQGFIYLNAQGKQVAYNPSTGQTGTVAPGEIVSWS